MPRKMNVLRGWAVAHVAPKGANWSQFKYVARTKEKAVEQWALAHGGPYEGYKAYAEGLKTKTLRVVKIRVEEN